MQFITRRTTILVPVVYCTSKHKGRVYIVMEAVEGKHLADGWYQRPAESKARIHSQLRRMVDEMRMLPPPSDVRVANVDSGPITDHRIGAGRAWGPFKTIKEFHKPARDGMDLEMFKESNVPRWFAELVHFHDEESRPVFTHGDLSPTNILVREDQVAAVLDWETAGWMPPYWEYASTWHGSPNFQYWREEVDNFLTPFPPGLKMETVRRKFFGDISDFTDSELND